MRTMFSFSSLCFPWKSVVFHHHIVYDHSWYFKNHLCQRRASTWSFCRTPVQVVYNIRVITFPSISENRTSAQLEPAPLSLCHHNKPGLAVVTPVREARSSYAIKLPFIGADPRRKNENSVENLMSVQMQGILHCAASAGPPIRAWQPAQILSISLIADTSVLRALAGFY